MIEILEDSSEGEYSRSGEVYHKARGTFQLNYPSAGLLTRGSQLNLEQFSPPARGPFSSPPQPHEPKSLSRGTPAGMKPNQAAQNSGDVTAVGLRVPPVALS